MSCAQRCRQLICCEQPRVFPQPYDFSYGHPDDLNTNRAIFESNFVRTSKYRWYNFLPLALILQFKRFANIYFLVIAILQTIPAISPLGPLTAWSPLIVVLGISILRQGYEDFQRYRSDIEINHEQKVNVLRDGKLFEVQWSDLVVGEVCYIKEEERFPADLLLLSSSIPGGTAFIETASLDGQKNLKPRSAFDSTQKYNSLEQLAGFEGTWRGIVPDRELHEFKSTMEIGGTNGVEVVHIDKDRQLLYRQARLKNTEWIYGLVIYTGRNSKIMMNSSEVVPKMSQVQVKNNYLLLFILIAQSICCIVVAILASIFIRRYTSTDTYIDWSDRTAAADATLIYFSYLVLINTMIPISLIVSIEIVKMTQSYFIDKDRFMYSNFRKKGPSVRSASLNEQLGQIQYVFSDKTGTLTNNRMEFKIALIGQNIYGDRALLADGKPTDSQGFHDQELSKLVSKGYRNKPLVNFVARDRERKEQLQFKTQKQLAHQYLLALSLAHEVVVATDKDGKSKYQGPSPDQITLVDAAKSMKYEFLRSTQSSSELSVNGETVIFELLQSFSFTSDRKRMSVIVRDSKGTIKMYSKGADNIIKQRLSKNQAINIDQQLDSFARIGLRTLLIAMRVISTQQYRQFRQKVDQLPLQNKEQAKEPLINQLETDLCLLGATAVLDRLQDGVPETIRDLIRAGIKVWMLTGDKMETAQNIAKSCNLIQSQFQVLRYTCKERDEQVIHKHFRRLIQEAKMHRRQGKMVSLLIQGPDLTPIMGDSQNQRNLAELSQFCESVVCCRLLPAQKADVVRVVRQQLEKITLSIGDGANDVPMIKRAHIGVGLFGEEGMGAVLASDYALPQFRMLWRLLLVHGRWNYMRISEMILYFFYKNMLFTIPQLVFAFYCGYSAQTIFDDIYIAMYNLVFTSLPLIIRAVFEQDLNYIQHVKPLQPSPESSRVNPGHSAVNLAQSKLVPQSYEINKYLYRLFPKLYFIGQQNAIFNYNNFFFWIIEGVIEAVAITLFSLYIFSEASTSEGGFSNDLWLTSLTIFTSVILIVTFKLATHTKFWSVLLFVVILVTSLGLYVAYMWISNYNFSDYLTRAVQMWYTVGETYFVVLFSVCLVLTIDGLILSLDYEHAGMLSRVREIVYQQKQTNAREYEIASVKVTNFSDEGMVNSRIV